ncbi:MAG TPA: DUF899 family protein [Candidatus Baltobacteraceae bacterium]|nr:DUF899 family protein [Candidatus Baltobacteraceae bacterium]
MSKTIADEAMNRFVMPNAAAEYVQARRALLDAEMELRDHVERVAARRRNLLQGPLVKEYEFFDGRRRIKLSELFEDGKPELFMYHVMYFQDDQEFCPMCSMWIDGLDGVAHHVMQRANIVAATLAPLEALQAWKERRGWRRIPVVADVDASFARDTGAQERDGTPSSTVLVFEKTPEGVRHTYTAHAEMIKDASFRGVDQLCPTWHVFDLLPSGRGDWLASNARS